MEQGRVCASWVVLLVLCSVGFGAVWGVATIFDFLRVPAVVGIREPGRC